MNGSGFPLEDGSPLKNGLFFEKGSSLVIDLNCTGVSLLCVSDGALGTEDRAAINRIDVLQLPLCADHQGSPANFGVEDNFKAVSESLPRLLGQIRENAGPELRTSVIIGANKDPFIPFERKLDSTLRFIELLLSLPCTTIELQTRSPLVILAIPLLRPLTKQVVVTVALETLDIRRHLAAYPSLPRPNERLEAACTLRGLGVWTCIQASPPAGEQEISSYGRRISTAADEIRVVNIHTRGPIHGRRRTSSQEQLRQWLKHNAPEKLGVAPTKFPHSVAESGQYAA